MMIQECALYIIGLTLRLAQRHSRRARLDPRRQVLAASRAEEGHRESRAQTWARRASARASCGR